MQLHWTPYTLKFMAGAFVLYWIAILLFESSRQNRRPGEEHGSAQWGNVKALDKKYRDRNPDNNVIITQHLQMGLDGKKHRRNLLQIILGGSGSGKTRFLALPTFPLPRPNPVATTLRLFLPAMLATQAANNWFGKHCKISDRCSDKRSSYAISSY